MIMMDAYKVKDVLTRIKNPDASVKIALTIVNREIAVRENQTNLGRLQREAAKKDGFEL